MKVLQSVCQQFWKTQQWPQDWKRSVFIPVPKKGNAKECSNYCTVALISHTSRVMLKILQARLQQYMNYELPDVQARFRKGRGGTIPWRRKWQPTPVFLPGKSHGRWSLVGYCPWGRKESDTTERLHFTSLQRNQRSNCQHLLDHRKSERVPEKHLFLLY